MFFRISLVALLFAAQLGTTLTQAYAPRYSLANDDNKPTTSTTTTVGLGHITLPQVIQQQQQQQKQQHQKQKLPLVTYITTSTTSTGGVQANLNQKYRGAPSKSHSDGGGVIPLQPAFVYDAAVPQQEDEQDEQKLKNGFGDTTKSKVDTAKHSDDDAVTSNKNNDDDDEASKKIIGSSVVTSVSVILNGDEPTFTDALGHKVPKPQPSLQVASPIDLLNPDRYEFYTFDENGELVKRLMTMQEIQSIVANGDGEGPSIIHTALQEDIHPEKNVQDIVNSVQNVLNKEVASSKHNTTVDVLPVLDTPDVSSSWSLILPAIFGNTGGDIFPQQKPPQIAMTPDSELVETSTKVATPTRATKKPKPSKRKPGQKRKPTTTATTSTTTEIAPQVVQEELDPMESVYTGMQQFQNLAASMQNFNGFSDLHMQPIYEKLPSTTAKPSSTTRRVFVNNQELVQSTSASFTPVTVSTSSAATEQILLNANLAKKPANVPLKHIPPHRIKKPNGGVSTTKHPLGSSTNKQKIKKKTSTTTTTTTTTTTPIPTEPPTPETTTTTTAAPPTQPPTPPMTTTTTQSPISTTQKKKKRKPTRQPGHNATSTNGKPGKPKRKPSAKPNTTTQHQHQSSDLDPAASAHHDATHPHQQIISNAVHKPRPQRPHNRPAHLGNGHRKSSTTTTTTPEPVTTTTPESTTTSTTTTTTTEATTTTTTTTTEPTTTTSTTTTTTTTTPIPITTTPTNPPVTIPISIAPHHPAHHHQGHRKPPPQHLHDRPIYHKKPVHNFKPHYDDDNVSTQSSIESYDLLSSLPPKIPLISTTTSSSHYNLSGKPISTIATTTSIDTLDDENAPAYQVPIFDKNQKLPTSSDDIDIALFKKTTMPSLALIQQQLQQQSSTSTPSSQLAPDMNTILSMDQIVQSLTQDQSNKVNNKDNAAVKEDTQPPLSSYQQVKPVEYETAATPAQIAAMVEKKKVAITSGGASVTSSPVTPGSTTIVTTIKPLLANYGASTLATTLADLMTHASTESSEQDTTISEDSEQNTPFVVITARPQYFAGTTTPETLTTLMEEQKTETPDLETTEVPFPIIKTQMQNLTKEQGAQVVKFEPLFADVQEPIITTFTESNTEVVPSTEITERLEDTTITITDISDKLDTQDSNGGESETTESESISDETPNIHVRLPVMRPPHIDSLSFTTEENTETPPHIADLVPQLNLDVLHPKDEISMSNFQTQAATVASTLVDGTNTLLGADSFMSSNETKTEIEFLMSDVIQQMTNPESKPVQEYKPIVENSNRLTNFAQFNTSFLKKPTPIKHEEIVDPKTDSSIENETTESIESEEFASSTISPEEQQEVTTPLVYEEFEETTTTIPGQQIKKEEIDLQIQKDEIPLEISTEIPSETSTVKTPPILSLAQIYAQEQQDENDMLELLQMQKDKIKDTNVQHQEEDLKDQPLKEYHTELKPEEADNSGDIIKSSPQQSPVEENQSDKKVEDSSASSSNQMEESLEQNNKKNATISEKLDSITESNQSNDEKDEEDEMPQMLTNNYNEQSTQETNELSTEVSASEASTEEQVSKEADLPTNQAASVNESSSLTAPIKEESIENGKSEEQSSADNTETIEDSATNAASLQAVYISEPSSSQEHTNKDEKESQDSKNDTIKEQVTKIPGDMTIVSSEADVTLNSDQVSQNQKIEHDNKEKDTDEELTEELTAEIDDQNTNEEKTKEADYIKLGETVASLVIKTSQEEGASNSHKSSTESNDSVEQTPPQPISLEYQPIHENDTNVENAPVVAISSSSSSSSTTTTTTTTTATSKIEEDEEDELDQTGYQVPSQPAFNPEVSSTTTFRTTTSTTEITTTTPQPTTTSTTKRLNTLKPVSYYVQPSLLAGYNQAAPGKVPINNSNSKITPIYHQPAPPKVTTYSSVPSTLPQQRPMQRPAALTNLMASSTQATRPPVKLEPSPDSSKGLEASVAHLDDDLMAFSNLCNELAFSYWKSITSERISSARSLVISPFALTSMLSMVFLGARGSTSGEMNEILKLDDMVTFNPHLVFKNITDSVEHAIDSDIATTAFVREIFSDRANGKILQFFKEKTQQLYAGHVEEVNFHVVNDIIRRRTNLLVKRHSMGKVMEYLRTNSVWVNGPLATISANLFQTDCSHGSTQDRDGEMFFQVHPSVRQRRLVPIPAVLYKSGFTAGYEPKLDATVVAFGRIQDTVSTIYLMPGHQSSISPADNLDRLEHDLVELAFSENAWKNILTCLMDRPGMEVQLPRFSHRSFVNATLGLQKMGLKGLFKSDFADLRGLTGAANHDIFLSDMIQINTFSTCGEEKISDHHHVEMYPAPPLRKRNKDVDTTDDDAFDSSEAIIDFGSLVHESALGRGFYDDLLDPKYLELPLPLRPRQARVPDAPRLRFDKPFLYFVRHNPTGMILYMGRFNPRLLP